MPESLSQNQIDELLQRMRSGEVNTEEEKKPKLKDYDFSLPRKFTKEQLRSLSGLYENFSKIISSYFTSILRGVCEVSVLQIEEERYFEFSNALPDASLTAFTNIKPKAGMDQPADQAINTEETPLLMDFSTNLGFFMIERLLGGTGKTYAPQRVFTDIETAVLQTVIESVIQYLQETWTSYTPVDATLNSIETNARILQPFSPQDIVVIVSLNVELEDFGGLITVCIPADSLEGVMGAFRNRYSRNVKHNQQTENNRDVIMNTVKKSNIEITAVLDQFQMSLGDILNLQVHDVVALNKNINSDICVMVDGKPWYNAKLGVSKLKKCVKIIDVIAG